MKTKAAPAKINFIENEINRLAKYKSLKGKVYPYILNAINFDGYDVKEPQHVDELLQTLFDTFVSEKLKNHKQWQKYYGGIHAAFADWLMGLPSSIAIDFYNHKIIEIAEQWGQISPNLSDKKREAREDLLCENWFNFITQNCFMLFNKYNVNTTVNF